MKVTLFFLASMLSIGFAVGQVVDSVNNFTYEYYMEKSRKQKNAGLLLTVAGVSGLAITTVIASLDAVGTAIVGLVTGERKHKSYAVPFILSGVTTIGGVVLLFESSSNKNMARAISLGLEMETAPILRQQTVKNYTYPSLSLKIKL